MTTEPVALILAAGASTRFEGRPKALLTVGGEPAIQRVVRLSREVGFLPRVVVGPHAAATRAALQSPLPDIVENADWVLGRTGSIQAGLEGLGAPAAVLLWPVDHPFVQAMTPRRLRSTADREAMGVWFIPTFEGKGGHPVLLTPPVLARVRGLAPSAPLRSLLPLFGPQVVRVPVEDPGVRANIDTPEAYQKFLSVFSQPGDLS